TRPKHRARRSADDAAGRRKYQMSDLVFRGPGRQGAAALAPDDGHHQRSRRPWPVDHDPDCRASRRAAAWARIVAQPVPDPSELSRDREAATGRAADAFAPPWM